MFGAALLPYFVALWCFGGRSRWLAACGVVASTVIVLSSGSSGPVGAYGAAILGLLMWRFRYRMRAVRWGIVAILVGLQLVMKAPVWWAISHISIFSGNTAFYRANLIDKFITHFSNWWLLGTRNTLGWGQADGDYVGQGVFRGADITNMFVRVGVDGGLLTLILFVLGIVLCFRGVGTSLRSAAFARESRSRQFAIWALGVALFTNVVAFFDVQYFDQNIVMWCLLLAMISCITKLLSRIPQSAEISDEVSNTVGEFQPQSAARGSAVW
jgi:hypothetical protein